MDTTARDLGTFVQRRPSCWFITAAKRKQQWRWSWGKRQSVARTWLKMENYCAHFSCAENKAQTSSMPSSAEHPYQFDSRVILMYWSLYPNFLTNVSNYVLKNTSLPAMYGRDDAGHSSCMKTIITPHCLEQYSPSRERNQFVHYG